MPEDRKTNVNNLTIVWQGQSWSVITAKGEVIFRSTEKREAFEFARDTLSYVSSLQPANDYVDKDFKEFEPLLRDKPRHSKSQVLVEPRVKELEEQLRLARESEARERKARQRDITELGQRLDEATKRENKERKAKEFEVKELEAREREVKELESNLREAELREAKETPYPFEFNEPETATLDGFLQSPDEDALSDPEQKKKRSTKPSIAFQIWNVVIKLVGIVLCMYLLFIVVSAIGNGIVSIVSTIWNEIVSFGNRIASVGVANILIFLSIVGIIILTIVAFIRYMFESGVLMGVFGVLLLLGSCGLCGYFGLLPF